MTIQIICFFVFNNVGNKFNDDYIKIFYTGENIVPDFNKYDYARGFNYISFSNRYLIFPLWAYNKNYLDIYNPPIVVDDYINREFCSFIYSNHHTEHYRKKLFETISSYKRVDSGGQYMNNIGYYVDNKLDFISKYKFNIVCLLNI